MVKESKPCTQLEWRINMPDGTTKVSVPESMSRNRIYKKLQGLIAILMSKFGVFLQNAWKLATDEPKKVMHCVKVGMALSLVSLFYYMRPLYEGVGGNAMWAVMTVVVVFEYTVGATLSKCVNRAIGTLLAGALGVGVHWIATQSGGKFEPIILQGSVFLLAAAATFSRFIPSIKARFDYGAMIFILTFSLVSVSGYREENLFELARHRLLTIAIGAAICILKSMLFCPVWAGNELHNLIQSNMEKLSDSLDGCVASYFRDDVKASNAKNDEASQKMLNGHKCVLNSKANEESLANFARWEPAHRNFSFRHPWQEYTKVGASLRSCAYCIEALNSTITSDTKAPDFLKKHFSKSCKRLSSKSSAVLKELATIVFKMAKSSKIDVLVEEMRDGVKELDNVMASFSKQLVRSNEPKTHRMANGMMGGDATVTLIEIVPLVTVSSLLVDIAARVEKIVETVNGLADKAKFKDKSDEELKMMLEWEGDTTMTTLQKV